MLITSSLSVILSVLAPHDCLGCGAEGALMCANCRPRMRTAVPRCFNCQRFDADFRTCVTCRRLSAVYSVRAAVRYEELAKNLVWKLKFGRARAAANEIGGMMAMAFTDGDFTDILVTHVPTANNRVRQRGYDQAALIAKAFAGNKELRYTPLLARLDKHKQVGASRAVRKQQLATAFRPIHAKRITGATILLVDDVVTTGATLEAAAAALRAAGARRVIGAVFAQA